MDHGGVDVHPSIRIHQDPAPVAAFCPEESGLLETRPVGPTAISVDAVGCRKLRQFVQRQGRIHDPLVQEGIAGFDIAPGRLPAQHRIRIAFPKQSQALVAEVQIVFIGAAAVGRSAERIGNEITHLRQRRIDRGPDTAVEGFPEHKGDFLPDAEVTPQVGHHLAQTLHIAFAQCLRTVTFTLVPQDPFQGSVLHRSLASPNGFGIELRHLGADFLRIIPLFLVECIAGSLFDPLVQHRPAAGVDDQQHRPAGLPVHLPGKGDAEIVTLHLGPLADGRIDVGIPRGRDRGIFGAQQEHPFDGIGILGLQDAAAGHIGLADAEIDVIVLGDDVQA